MVLVARLVRYESDSHHRLLRNVDSSTAMLECTLLLAYQ